MDQAIWLSRAIHRADEDRRRQELMQMLLDPAAAAAAAASLMMPNLRNQNLDCPKTDANPGPPVSKSSNYYHGNQQLQQASSSGSNTANLGSNLIKRRKLSRHSELGINGNTNHVVAGKSSTPSAATLPPPGPGSNLLTAPAPTRPPPLTLGRLFFLNPNNQKYT